MNSEPSLTGSIDCVLCLQFSISYFFVSRSCFVYIQKVPKNKNVTTILNNLCCECVEMLSSTKSQILWLGTMGKAPKNRLLYVPEKNSGL